MIWIEFNIFLDDLSASGDTNTDSAHSVAGVRHESFV